MYIKMEQQKLQPNGIDAHICQMIGIAKHDFCYFTPANNNRFASITSRLFKL